MRDTRGTSASATRTLAHTNTHRHWHRRQISNGKGVERVYWFKTMGSHRGATRYTQTKTVLSDWVTRTIRRLVHMLVSVRRVYGAIHWSESRIICQCHRGGDSGHSSLSLLLAWAGNSPVRRTRVRSRGRGSHRRHEPSAHRLGAETQTY